MKVFTQYFKYNSYQEAFFAWREKADCTVGFVDFGEWLYMTDGELACANNPKEPKGCKDCANEKCPYRQDSCWKCVIAKNFIEAREPEWLFRLESRTPDNGLWYDSSGKFVFGIGKVDGCATKELPMGYDPRYHEGGFNWFSACSNKEDLMHWYSLEDAKYLVEHGFVFTRYLAKDWNEFENQAVFRKDTAMAREEIDITKLFEEVK